MNVTPLAHAKVSKTNKVSQKAVSQKTAQPIKTNETHAQKGKLNVHA